MKKYSIIKFGSQLNCDFDKYSDKDLLVATEKLCDLIPLHQHYTKSGWSVSGYTYSKLEYLSRKGSLFLTHLKLNSEIIFDFNNIFNSILDKHIENENYNTELMDSVDYFKIIDKIPNLQLGYAWFADCFYVGLRNYMIFENANRGIYEFSYLKIIELLLNDNRIDLYEYKVLKELRVVKHNYRENILDELPSKSFLHTLILVGKRLGLLEEPVFISPVCYFDNALRNVYRKDLNGYQKLRLIEGIYCSKNVNIPEIKKLVSNPQFYASKLMDDNFLNHLIVLLKKGELCNLTSLQKTIVI